MLLVDTPPATEKPLPEFTAENAATLGIVSVTDGKRCQVRIPHGAFRPLGAVLSAAVGTYDAKQWDKWLAVVLTACGLDAAKGFAAKSNADYSATYSGKSLGADIPPAPRQGPLWGLLGKAGAGKDSFFAALGKAGVDCKRFAFADELKREVADALGVSVVEINANKPAYRPVLQWWGEWRRGQNENYWVEKVAARIDREKPEWQGVAVITDVRYPNEAEFVFGRSGSLIRITRADAGLDGEQGNHPSETIADKIAAAMTVPNDGTREELTDLAGLVAEHFNAPTK